MHIELDGQPEATGGKRADAHARGDLRGADVEAARKRRKLERRVEAGGVARLQRAAPGSWRHPVRPAPPGPARRRRGPRRRCGRVRCGRRRWRGRRRCTARSPRCPCSSSPPNEASRCATSWPRCRPRSCERPGSASMTSPISADVCSSSCATSTTTARGHAVPLRSYVSGSCGPPGPERLAVPGTGCTGGASYRRSSRATVRAAAIEPGPRAVRSPHPTPEALRWALEVSHLRQQEGGLPWIG